MMVSFCWWNWLFRFEFVYTFILVVISVMFVHKCEAV